MSMTDPIADFLTRIRNGIMANKVDVVCPRSKIKLKLAEILKDEGFVDAVSKSDDSVQGSIAVTLRYDNRHNSAITGIKRISKPGQRRYVGASDLPKVRNGLGVAILSTSKGLMTDRKARELGVGGEVLCEIW
jgi:small subunit ribosomal protein S8